MHAPTHPIIRFSSRHRDPDAAIAEIAGQIEGTSTALVVLFVAASHDHEAIQQAIKEHLGAAPVIGCTTAGEIAPDGYQVGGVAGFALPAEDFQVETDCLERLTDFEYREGSRIAAEMRRRLELRGVSTDGSNTFAFLLVDGMSRREESLAAALHAGLGDVTLFGGSAGDGGSFERTWVYSGDRFRTDSAVLTLIHTQRPFHVFRTQHFVASGVRMVVTSSDPARRIVSELDGLPATVAYASHLGVPVEQLGSKVFACHPVVVKMGGEYFVRSIMRSHPDGSIEFACAIDRGVVLRLAQGNDLVANLERSLNSLEDRIGPPELIVGCDCLFRKVEATTQGLEDRIGEIFRAHRVIGFTSYGEQYNAVHVNQTLTGVAIGSRRAA